MVVSFDICTILIIINAIVYPFAIFPALLWDKKAWNKIVRLIALIVLIITHVLELQIENANLAFYGLTIFSMAMLVIPAIILACDIRNEN